MTHYVPKKRKQYQRFYEACVTRIFPDGRTLVDQFGLWHRIEDEQAGRWADQVEALARDRGMELRVEFIPVSRGAKVSVDMLTPEECLSKFTQVTPRAQGSGLQPNKPADKFVKQAEPKLVPAPAPSFKPAVPKQPQPARPAQAKQSAQSQQPKKTAAAAAGSKVVATYGASPEPFNGLNKELQELFERERVATPRVVTDEELLATQHDVMM